MENITFYLQVYYDMWLADLCLNNLRKHYSTSRVILVSDGNPDDAWISLAMKYGCEYTEGERLYLMENGGAMIHRGLKLFLDCPTDYLIKIDSDTLIHRRLNWLPDKDSLVMFGTVITSAETYSAETYSAETYSAETYSAETYSAETYSAETYSAIQGGCVGHTIATAKLLYESNVFCDDALRNTDTYVPHHHRDDGRDIIFEDWLRGYCANKVGVKMVDHPEVCSRWGDFGIVNLPDGDFAITHPNPIKAGNDKKFFTPQDLKDKLVSVLDEHIKFTEIHYVNWSNYQNPGDHVIATAGAVYLNDRNIRVHV